MTGDPDLYPPDDEELTPEAKSARARAFWGVALVTFGCGLIAERIFSADIEYFFLSIGFGFIAGWLTHRRYGWFVAGAILTGVGVADVLGHLITGVVGSAIACFAVAAGFASIYVRYPHRSSWSLVPAAIFGFFGVVMLGFGLVGAVAHAASGVLMPGLLIAGGVLLLNRNRLPHKTVKIGLIVLVALFLFTASSSDRGPRFDRSPRMTVVERDQTFPADLTQLVVRTTSGDVDLSVSDGNGRVELSGRGRPRVEQVGTVMTISAGSADVDLEIPPNVDVVIRTDSGDIEGTVPGRPTIEARTSADVELDDEEQTAVEGANTKVTLRSDTGDIDVEREAA